VRRNGRSIPAQLPGSKFLTFLLDFCGKTKLMLLIAMPNFVYPHNPPLGDGALMKFTQSNLDKLEDILGESGYTTRYERGTFQSGWCLLEQKRIVVLNKFLDTEGRINTLMELIPQLQIDFDKLTHESQKLYEDVMKKVVQS
jgi:hypothetical protein